MTTAQHHKPTTVTFVSMIMAGGPEGAVYGVYRGRISYRRGVAHSINLNHAEHFASVTVPKGGRADYFQIAKDHETPGYPAFNWGRL